MKTALLTRKDIEGVLTPAMANQSVEAAFRAYGLGEAMMPPKSYLTFEKGDLRSMPAYLFGQGFMAAGIKSVNVHPQNPARGLPTVMAVIILTDPETGFPLAILDGTYLTALRTGAAGALAAKYLSRETSAEAGFVGCGVQARAQLSCLMEVRRLRKVRIWAFPGDDASTRQFRDWAAETYGLETVISGKMDDVTMHVDILVTTTPSRVPLVKRVSPGTHINAIGADAAGKQEIFPSLLKGSTIVVDDWTQASHSGEINVPLRDKDLSADDIHGELGRIVAGRLEGRSSAGEVTVFDATGLAIQDIACASVVYEALKSRRGIRRVALF